MPLNIRYDFNGFLQERIGQHGVTLEQVQEMDSRLKVAHQAMVRDRKSAKLGFWDLPYDKKLVARIEKLAKSLKSFDNFVVIGIGGSALGNIALQSALRHPHHNELDRKKRGNVPRLFIPDNIDPDRLTALIETIDLKKTVFNVISKSGNTAEGMSTFMWLYSLVEKKVGKAKAAKHFVLTTDDFKGALRQIANKLKCETLPIPDNVGGRFSVMTAVGLLSASVTGINIKKLLKGAAEMDKATQSNDWKKNPALAGAAFHYLMYVKKNKNIQIFMPYSHALRDVADWFRQLWAESLGKTHRRDGQKIYVGQTPEKSVGVTDQHSQVQLYMEGPFDKVITFVTVDKFKNTIKIPKVFAEVDSATYLCGQTINKLLKSEEAATQLALNKMGRPTCAIHLPKVSEETVGALMYLLEAQTAYVGELLDINAFDQPGVELGKDFAYGMMGKKGYEAKKKEAADSPNPNTNAIIKS
jgi:glucose-6-phosphate isomerase